jgi:hypothetical protein
VRYSYYDFVDEDNRVDSTYEYEQYGSERMLSPNVGIKLCFFDEKVKIDDRTNRSQPKLQYRESNEY